MKIRPTTSGRKPWHTDEYVAYLESGEWAEIRAAALERAGHRCENVYVLHRVVREEGGTVWTEDEATRCPETDGLQVHHRHYVRFGHEQPEDLQVLCGPHHERADRDRQRTERNATLKRKYGDWRPNR